MTATFDLVNSPWIPCIDKEGRRGELGLLEALVRAHELAELRDESPLTTVALHRLLLAVLHASLEGPKDHKAWKALWEAGRWDPGKVERYLKKWRSRFDLFDEQYPFFQVGGFEITGKEGTPVTKLTHELATGNIKTLFDHTVEERPTAVSPGVAARWLVACQSYSLGGGVGATSNRFKKHPNFTHAPMVGGVAVLLQGTSLFETLTLNLVVNAEEGPVPTKGNDKPTWEQDRIDGPSERRPRGLMEFLTWRARMVRLLPEVREGSLVVENMHFASGWELAGRDNNPSWGYVSDPKKGLMPVGLREGRDLWRDSSALLTVIQETDGGRNKRPASLELMNQLVEREVLPPTATLRLLTLGIANDKAKVLFWRRDAWNVPACLVQDSAVAARLLAALSAAEVAGKATYAALSNFKEHFKEGLAEIRDRGMAAYWGALDTPFRRLVADIAAPSGRAIDAWLAAVVASSRDALEDATDNVQRRSARELQARVDARGLLEWKLKQVTRTGREIIDGIV